MKKLLVLMLASLVAISAAACTDTNTDSENDEKTSREEQGKGSTDKDDEEDISDLWGNDGLDEGTKLTLPDMQETVLVEEDDFSITLKSFEIDEFWGPTIKLELENTSDDTVYKFSSEAVKVNNAIVSGLIYEDINAGKKSIADMNISTDLMEKYGLEKITDVSIEMVVKDVSAEWDEEPAYHDTIHIYPYGEEAAEVMKVDSSDVKEVAVDNDYVTLSILDSYDDDFMGGFAIDMVAECNTDKNIAIEFSEVYINDTEVSTFTYVTLTGDELEYFTTNWYESTLEESGITEIEEIEFNIEIMDLDSFDTLAEEVYTFKP